MTYRCKGALVHRDGVAILIFSHACEVTTGDVSLMGQTARIPWSSIPRWIASMNDSLSGVGFMSGMIPFIAYLSKDGEDVRVTFCQPETIRRTILESVDGPVQDMADKIGWTGVRPFPAPATAWRVNNGRGVGTEERIWRDFEVTIRRDLESRSKHVFEGKPDVILKAEIFRRKTA